MKITRMKTGEWSNIRAFFDLETSEGFTLKGFKIVLGGEDGQFVAFPSQKGKDNEYYDTIWADKDLKQKVKELAFDHYQSEENATATDEGDFAIPF